MSRRSRAEWGGERHASSIRASVLLIWLAIVVFTPYDNYHSIPRDMVAPHGIGRVLFGIKPIATVLWLPNTLSIIKWCTALACLVALLLPSSGKLTMPAVCFGVLTLDSTTKAVSTFVSHGQIAPLHVLVILTMYSSLQYRVPWYLAPLTQRRPVPTEAAGHYQVVSLTAAVLTVPYVFIGIHRMLRGGLQLFEGDALLWVLSGTSRGFEAYGGFDPSEVRGVFNAGFFLVTLLEIGALLVVHSRTFRFFWLVGISASHLAIIGLMNIMFWENILLLWTTFGWQWRNAQCAERVGLSPPP